jgi:hypothetical protein
LLVEYVNTLQTGLERADKLTRAGELGQAVWAYLSVLEVDPDNAVARRQVGDVAIAVRHFGGSAPGRRGLTRFWNGQGEDMGAKFANWMWVALVALLMVIAFGLGYTLASRSADGDPQPHQPPPRIGQPDNRLG